MPNNLPASGYSEYISEISTAINGQINTIQIAISGLLRTVGTILSTYISGPSSVSAGTVPVFVSPQELEESAVSIAGTGIIQANGAQIDMSVANTINIAATNVMVNSAPVLNNGDLAVYMPKSGGTFTGPITLSQIIPTSSAGISIPGKLFISGTRPVCSGGFSMTTNPADLTNSATETDVLGSGLGTLTFTANTLTVGACSRSFLGGNIDTTGTPTITFRVYVGPTSSELLSTFVIPLPTITLVPWRLEKMLTCRALGSGTSGQFQMNSFFVLHDTKNASTWVNNPLVGIDTTVDNILNITAQWSAASTGNVLRVNTFNTVNTFFS